MLTTKQAWRKIAKAYEAFVFTGNRPVDTLAEFGFCTAVVRLRNAGQISDLTKYEMKLQTHDALVDAGGVSWLFNYDLQGAEHRSILATLFAEMS